MREAIGAWYSATIAFPNLHFKAYPEAVDFYEKVYDEVKYRAENKISLVPGGGKYRLYWYLIMPWYYIGIYNWLEQEFGATTINIIYEGGDVPDEDIIDYDFPLESIARKMYNNWWRVNCGCPERTPREVQFVLDYDIDGVISLMVASCRRTAHVLDTWKRFTDRLKLSGATLPTLGIEADMVDTRTYSDALVKDMLTAFMETVDEAKRKRQAAGLESS